jgi:hypothetical protein
MTTTKPKLDKLLHDLLALSPIDHNGADPCNCIIAKLDRRISQPQTANPVTNVAQHYGLPANVVRYAYRTATLPEYETNFTKALSMARNIMTGRSRWPKEHA